MQVLLAAILWGTEHVQSTDHSQDISKLYCLLEMTHEHEIAGLVPTIMNGMMVDVTQHGSGSDPEGGRVQIMAQETKYIHDCTCILTYIIIRNSTIMFIRDNRYKQNHSGQKLY